MGSKGRFFIAAIKFLVTLVVIVTVVGAGVASAVYMMKNSPQPNRQKPPQLAPLVQTLAVQGETRPVPIRALGKVIPAVEVTLSAQVAGQVMEIHPLFRAGGIVPADTILARIDARDYELAIPLKEAQLEAARADLLGEQGQQEVARREWELLDMKEEASELDAQLALRQPQLRQKEAAVRSAEAALEKARLDLDRTAIKAPCNAMFLDTQVNVGDLATTQRALASLVGTDVYWVEASIPVADLDWLDIPRKKGDSASPAKIVSSRGGEREGHILALLGDLEPTGRMARLRVEVEDPLSLKKGNAGPPLLLGEIVNMEFVGKQAEQVFSIPRDALRDGTQVWLAEEDGKFALRTVETVWSDAAVCLVRGLSDGDRVIISDLAGPVEGMALQVSDGAAPQESEPGAEGEK